MADAAANFQAVLNDLGVVRVLCIDDIYDSRTDIEAILAWAVLSKNHKALKGFLQRMGHDFDMSAETAQAELRKILEDSVNLAVSLQASICREGIKSNQVVDQELQLFTDRSVLHRLDELMEGFPDFRGLSPTQWDEQRATVLKSLVSEKTLFIFDESLGDGVQPGTEQILKIAGTQEGVNAYFSLLSYNIMPGTEHERTRYFQQQNVVATAIPKRDLSSVMGIEQLQVKLRAAVLWKESKQLRETCKSALEFACSNADMRVHELTPLEFDEVVFRSSYKEGVHEMDTLVRLYTNAFAAALREKLRSDSTALRDIDKLRHFRGAESDKISNGSSSWKLQRDEYYESGSYINSCMMPTEAGDIFQLNSEDGSTGEYVLIAPLCDLMVRSTSGRRKEGVTTAILCPILRDKPATNKLRETFQLDYYNDADGSPAWVYFAEGLTVDLWVLDLCAIDSKGQATRVLNDTLPDHLSDGWKKRCQEDLIPRCSKVFAAWKAWNALHKKTKEGIGVRPAYEIKLNEHMQIEMQVKKSRKVYILNIGVQRTQRLAPILERELIQVYGDYIARPARPHSLSMNLIENS